MALLGLIDSTVARLKVPVIIVFDVATKVLGTEEFPQHNIAEVNSGTTLIVLFSQEEPSRWKEINTQTNTRTHTHTHLLPAPTRSAQWILFQGVYPLSNFIIVAYP